MISDDNLSLNLYIMPTVYHIVIILDDKISERTKELTNILFRKVRESVLKDFWLVLSQFPD